MLLPWRKKIEAWLGQDAQNKWIRQAVFWLSQLEGRMDDMDAALEAMEKKVADSVAHADSVAGQARDAIAFLRGEVEKLKVALSKVDPAAGAELAALKADVAGVVDRVSGKMDELDADMAKVGASGGV